MVKSREAVTMTCVMPYSFTNAEGVPITIPEGHRLTSTHPLVIRNLELWAVEHDLGDIERKRRAAWAGAWRDPIDYSGPTSIEGIPIRTTS
jgi:hypothetical protein